ncbi:MAG: ice-binding family protein [Microvirga sp.]|nr:ice-binding family protein [Microvirga sp.]
MALGLVSAAQAQDLDSFGVLAGSTITNTGPTVINGNIGVSPGTAITGFPPGTVLAPYAIFRNEAVAVQAQVDLTTAYNILAARPATVDITGQDLGGLTLTPGVYNSANSSQLTGNLTLDAQGDPNAVFILQIGSTLTTASASSITLINGAQGGNVYFQVGSSATLGTGTAFIGKILALSSITLNTNASMNCGSALARTGAVTLDSNTISICVLAATVTGNGAPVVGAISSFAAGGGALPLSFQVLLGVLSPAERAEAARQLSGEVATGVAPVGFQAMNSFLSLMFDNADGRGATPISDPGLPQRGTVSVLGYAPVASGPRELRDAFGAVRAAPAPRLWSVWGAGYGGRAQTDGDRATGSHDRSSRTMGVAAGADFLVAPDTRIGFALGGGATSFNLSGGMGGGTSDMIQAAVYARQTLGRAYVTGALAYARHDVDTSRVVTLGGRTVLNASFEAHNVAGQAEAGYRFGWFIPYAAISVQSFTTPSYSERGLSPFALSYYGRTTIATRSQLGFRTEQTIGLSEGHVLRLRTRAAWVRDHSEVPYVEAGFQALPGSKFRVNGAEQSRDSLLISAGAEVALANGLSLSGHFDAQLADGSRSYSARAQLRYTW